MFIGGNPGDYVTIVTKNNKQLDFNLHISYGVRCIHGYPRNLV